MAIVSWGWSVSILGPPDYTALVDTGAFDLFDYQDYSVDAAGNITSIDDLVTPSGSRAFEYNDVNQVAWDSGVSAASPTYSYDGNGNRLTRTGNVPPFTGQSLSYVTGKNRLATFGGSSVGYDAMGNVLTTGNGRALTYDAAGRLKTVDDSSTTNSLEAAYNGLGELAWTWITTPGACSGAPLVLARECFNFSPDGRALHLEMMNVSRTSYDYVWLDDLPVAQFLDSYDAGGVHQSAQLTYIHPDHLGTPRFGTDEFMMPVFRYRSDAFGNATELTGRVVRLRFPEQMTLGVGGIHYNYFRDYDPTTGRYLESDPIGLNGGLNTYGYVGQNPVSLVDPEGPRVTAHSRLVDDPRARLIGARHSWLNLEPDDVSQVQCMLREAGLSVIPVARWWLCWRHRKLNSCA